RVQNYLETHNTLIRPARRIPHDIVEAIFVACLPTDRHPVMAASEAPLHICSAWRALAISTPRLWVSLRIVVDVVLHNQYGTTLASEWLERSGTFSLSLEVLEQPEYLCVFVDASP
ncbi:hypothetical protein B0H19DRAFT_916459, partial [Mycena capillaripes]